jgi:hypothetical protein
VYYGTRKILTRCKGMFAKDIKPTAHSRLHMTLHQPSQNQYKSSRL